MKVFLKEDVPGVGKALEVVTVSDGYARNYLLPRGLAVRATEERVNAAQQHAQSQVRREERARTQAQDLAASLADKEIVFTVKAGETGRLYGSITSADIAEKLSTMLETQFDKRWVALDRPIRDVGTHVVDLKLAGGVRGRVNVTVEPIEA
jgi:large subunit ribosomal protein L9